MDRMLKAFPQLPWNRRRDSVLRLKDCPPEILRQIFLQCCGDEFIDLLFVGTTPQDRQHKQQNLLPLGNTVLILRRVCKQWLAIVDLTPQLWQRLCLQFEFINLSHHYWKLFSTPQVRDAFQRCAAWTKHMILPLSSGHPLHIHIAGDIRTSWSNHLLNTLVEEGHRWSTLSVSAVHLSSSGLDLFHRRKHGSTSHSPGVVFPILRSLALHLSTYEPHGLNLTESLPQLSSLAIYGTPLIHKLPVRWDKITTLVLAFRSTTSSSVPQACLTDFTRILHATSNLIRLQWQGTFNLKGNIPQGAGYVRLDKLRFLSVQDSDLEFCTTVLPIISCPQLASFELVVGEPNDPMATAETPATTLESNIGHTTMDCQRAAESLKQFLSSVPLLEKVTVVHIPFLSWHKGTWRLSSISKRRAGWGSTDAKYLVLAGTQTQIQEQLGSGDPFDGSRESSFLLPLLQVLAKLSSTFTKPDLVYIPPLTIPNHAMSRTPKGDAKSLQRSLQCYSEHRLTSILEFVDYLSEHAQFYETGSIMQPGNSDLESARESLGCDPVDWVFFEHFMEIVVAPDFALPSPCRVTSVFVI